MNEGIKVEHTNELSKFALSHHGDLRKAIGELQAITAGGKALSSHRSERDSTHKVLLELMINRNNKALTEMHNMLFSGHSVKEICHGLHDVLLKEDYDSELKYKFLRIIGETEYRSQTMTPRIVASWMIAQI